MTSKFNISLFCYSLSLFSGISYLWGFWLSFDINILSFVALTDIVKASVYPTLPAIGILAAYSAMDGINAVSKEQQSIMISEGGFAKGFSYFFTGWCIFLAVFSFGNAIYTAFTETGYMRLRGIYPLIGLALFFYTVLSNKFVMKVPMNLRVFIISIICFLPVVSFNKGFSNGQLAANHEEKGFYLESKGYCSSSKTEKFRYISNFGSRIFTISSKDNSICVSKSDEFKLIKYNVKNHNKNRCRAADTLFGC
ncbi:hypothetical protein [Moritella sp.]|uniref:hypothetical protein n=1 Tax=Moritella sp. TaxID=78556 RepID=UPI001D3A57CA|nr:hypothetical protein [Moritella sp.]MCJ8352387.1 hypothetical protein [Moritella sp.]NQZ42668.1 hypothetical protein [Moritella sp.]